MKVSNFFATDYVDYASYDNLRKIASAIDGQKNTARKIINTVIDKNITTELKVSQLSSKMAEHTEYLHGDASGVIVTMAQSFAGTNNIPLLDREGNFGTRFSPEASAPRYIYTNGSKEMWEMFNKQDNPILIEQYFEGDKIEPMFYVPSLPLLLINGSEGVSSGFAQKILPRDPKAVRSYLKKRLSGESVVPFSSKPHFNGFSGTVRKGDADGKWEIVGNIERKSITKVEITEIPVTYNLKSYLKVLDDLEDKGVINSYRDKSDNDIFRFEVNFASKDLKAMDDEKLLEKLKLVKKVTENYTCFDAENKIRTFSSVGEIMDYYYDVKIEFLKKRKAYQIDKIIDEIKVDGSRYLFIKLIVDDKLVVNKRKKADIEKDLEGHPKVLKRDGNYDYLLDMNIGSLTVERMARLMENIKAKKQNLDKLMEQPVEVLWTEEI